MSNNINPIRAAVEKFSHITEGILARFKGYDEDVIKTIMSDEASELQPEDFGSLVFNEKTLQAMYPNGKIIGVIGKPTRSAYVTSMTRIGNVGNYMNLSAGYIQLSFLPGEMSEVSATNHDVVNGELKSDVMFPQGIVNLKIFSTSFDEDELGSIENLMQNFFALQTGRTHKTQRSRDGAPKPIYRGTNLVVYFQGDYPKVVGDTMEISVTAIAIVDTRPGAAKQLLAGWGTEPVKLKRNRMMGVFANESTALEAMGALEEGDEKDIPDSTDTPPSIMF